MTIPGDSHLEIHASCATYVLTEVGGIALALCCSGRSEPANSGVLGRWRELNLICHWEDHLSRLCDTTWSYWLRDLLPTLLSDLQRVPSLPPLFSAFAQPLQRLPIGRARQEFLKELRQALEDGIIQPICAKLEEDLRLLVHATMQVTRQSLPLSPPEDVLAFLRLRPLRLTESDVVDIKDQVGRCWDTGVQSARCLYFYQTQVSQFVTRNPHCHTQSQSNISNEIDEPCCHDCHAGWTCHSAGRWSCA